MASELTTFATRLSFALSLCLTAVLCNQDVSVKLSKLFAFTFHSFNKKHLPPQKQHVGHDLSCIIY